MATIHGTAANNMLSGTSANDTIDGKAGVDTVIYAGNAADYRLQITSSAQVSIMDQNSTNGNDGVDTLIAIEKIKFSDREWSISQGTDRRVNSTVDFQQSNSTVILLSTGDSLVTWRTSSTTGVMAIQRYNNLGIAQSGEILLPDTSSSEFLAKPIALIGGGFVLSWSERSNQCDVYFARYDANGALQGSVVRANNTDSDAFLSDIILLKNGDFVVSWTLFNSTASATAIQGQRYNSLGVAQGRVFQQGQLSTNAVDFGGSANAKISATADGGFVLAWIESDGSSVQGYAQRYNSSAVAQSNPFQLGELGTDIAKVAITTLSNGDFVATWFSYHAQSADQIGIRAQRYNSQGVPQGDLLLINSSSNPSQEQAQVVALSNGNFIVLWQDPSDYRIHGAQYNNLSVLQGSEFLLPRDATAFGALSVSAVADGGFIVSFSAPDRLGSTYSDIYSQRYDENNQPIGIPNSTLIIKGSDLSDPFYLMSSTGNLIIDAGDGDDVIQTGSGDDILKSGVGNDLLNGGLNADLMQGGLGSDTYIVDNLLDVVFESAAREGVDVVKSSVNFNLGENIERLILMGSDHSSGKGNNLNNILMGNIGNNILDGGVGVDRMIGGVGNDRYFVDNSADIVTELLNQGVDTVYSSVSYVLGSNIESLRLQGNQHINATGNSIGNMLFGNSGRNILDGGAGADSLAGGLGNDSYIMARGYGLDSITDLDSTASNLDHLNFAANIAADQLWFSQSGNDLKVNIIGTADSALIKNWYSSVNNHVERLHSGNGKTLTDANVQNLVNAMAGITPPPMGQTTLTAQQHAQLDGVINANWV